MKLANTYSLGKSLIVVAVLVSCAEEPEETSAPISFCETLDHADTARVVSGGGNGSSGKVQGHFITDISDDIHDPNMVAFVEYVVENSDVGGVPQISDSDRSGDFVETLGAGSWLIRMSYARGAYSCQNEVPFVVQAGNTTKLCIELGCEERY